MKTSEIILLKERPDATVHFSNVHEGDKFTYNNKAYTKVKRSQNRHGEPFNVVAASGRTYLFDDQLVTADDVPRREWVSFHNLPDSTCFVVKGYEDTLCYKPKQSTYTRDGKFVVYQFVGSDVLWSSAAPSDAFGGGLCRVADLNILPQ